METALKIVGGLALGFALIFFGPTLGVISGAFAGWVVGIFWPHTTLLWLTTFGLGTVKLWQVGALLGFVGGFFKASSSSSSS